MKDTEMYPVKSGGNIIMAKYVIESPHTLEECSQALDETLEKDMLDKFVFGCMEGEHTGWAYVEADSDDEALENVPEFIRSNACAHKVGKFTPEQIKKAH